MKYKEFLNKINLDRLVIGDDGLDVNAVIDILKKLTSQDDYQWMVNKLPDNKFEVLTKNSVHYEMLKKYFEKEKISFYTYNLKDEEPRKVILKSSIPLSDSDIACLKENFDYILKINRDKFKTSDYVYVIDIKSDFVEKIQELLKVTKVDEKSVRFDKYERNLPPTCKRCASIGHIQSRCKMQLRCAKCAEVGHSGSNCIYKVDNTNNIPKDKIKCINCGEGHTAFQWECKARMEFYGKRQQLNDSGTFNCMIISQAPIAVILENARIRE